LPPDPTTVAGLRETLSAYFAEIANRSCDGTPGGLGDCIERLTKLPMSLFGDIAGCSLSRPLLYLTAFAGAVRAAHMGS
jgi:hypothetical protein